MSNRRSLSQARAAAEQAKAEAIKLFLPQLFSSPKILSGNAEDSGGIDAWMMSNIPPDIVLSLEGLWLIGDADNRSDLKQFVDLTLSALKGISGYTSNMGAEIAIAGFGGGKGKTMVKRRGFVSRHITHRGEPDYEEVGDEGIEE